jgi:hypothetical protein
VISATLLHAGKKSSGDGGGVIEGVVGKLESDFEGHGGGDGAFTGVQWMSGGNGRGRYGV